jgi:outer membrane protein assembly factor BamB
MNTMFHVSLAGCLAAVLLLSSGHALHGEGYCAYPYPIQVGIKIYVVDLKSGKGKELPRNLATGYLTGPIVFQGVMYTGDADNLVALDAQTGKTLWVSQPGLFGGIIATEEALYCDGRPRALNPKTGKADWMLETLGGSANILLTEELLVAGKGTGNELQAVRALDRKTGKERWQVPLRGGPFSLARATAALVFVGRTDDAHLLDLKTGRDLWQVRAEWPPRPESEVIHWYPRHFECAQQTLYRFKPPADRTDAGQIEALDVLTKKVRWQTPLPACIDWQASLGIVTDLLFLETKGEVYAFRTDTGKLQWQMEGVEMPYAGDAGKVYFVDRRAGVRAVDRKTGKLEWRFDGLSAKHGTMGSARMALAGDSLYVIVTELYDPRWRNAGERPEKQP